MKLHKIPGVDKDVCTCEQKIAYNLAFRIHINYWNEWENAKDSGEAERELCLDDLVIRAMLGYDALNAVAGTGKRYDRHAVKAALSAGLEKYLDRFFIADSYEQIGRAFPAAE
jgi:hypothetical protein